ncbi:polysaccharide biosynthesis tyrosine autokinase [Muricauda sp. SCSIO 64092]|uniref:GumC family protein n=1 Tax=Allomuricauda sp. SCSIO 64092 TaxID=2908842 RepID=UPI001FF68AC4|nr:tyrosine-protein kinase family protein [Muricauda sp. SCSIO 64092]UOY06106.1 polysaccharide biosynthesis tyrosine autokinase [Muricauda sp. SCSIO 64092]
MGAKLNNSTPSNKNLKEYIKVYTKHIHWFALSAIFAVAMAFLYIRYTTPQYQAKAKIQILEDKGSSPELSLFQELDIFSGSKNKVEDEIDIIKSRGNFIQVVKKLGINVRIIALGNIADTEIYVKPPFRINFISSDSIIDNSTFEFLINLNDSETSFDFGKEENKSFKTLSFGKNFPSPIGDIVITPTENFKSYKKQRFKVIVKPVFKIAESYKKKISLKIASEFSNIINISLNDPIQEKAEQILQALIETYNQNAVDDKRAIADKTSDFIEERINDIYSNLAAVDQSAEDFKTVRGLTDISSQANINLNVSAASQQELENAKVQLNIAASMKDIVDNQGDYDFLPSNIGLSDQSIATTTSKFNQLVAERKRLLKSSNEKNPVIVNLDQQLAGLKQSMQSSLNSIENNLNLKVNNLSGQVSQLNSRIYSAPKNERALRDITRRQQTTESLYLYLLQKREESQIAFASATPKSKVIDYPYGNNNQPISPNKPIIFLASFILGLAVPFSIVYLMDLMDNKIHNKANLEKYTGDIPVIAELPKIRKKEDTLIKTDERTVLAESLRILRTNLDYVLKSKSSQRDRMGSSIFVTSSVPGEGKTLVSFNLAMIYANANKKVLLIGADIRNPKIYQFYNAKNVDKLVKKKLNKDNLGLTDFLVNRELVPKDIISSILANNQTIDIIFAGKIPPNPTELLMNERMNDLFHEVKEKYDYIIVDTAPLMVVSDTLLISGNADLTLYVTRAGITENSVIEFPIQLQKEGKLKGLSFIVNGVKSANLGYGGKYGYGYGKSTKKWYQLFG